MMKISGFIACILCIYSCNNKLEEKPINLQFGDRVVIEDSFYKTLHCVATRKVSPTTYDLRCEEYPHYLWNYRNGIEGIIRKIEN